MNEVLKKLLESGEGWISADDPPENDRTVQVAWDDGSYGNNSLCFYDSKATIPESNEKFWWTHPGMKIMPHDHVIAWREVSDGDDRWYENDPEY